MKINNFKIRTQLLTGFSLIFLFVIILGIVSYNQTHQLHHQTTTMYEHPLQTRKAIDALEADIHRVRIAIRDLIIADDEQEKLAAKQEIEISEIDSERQFEILYDVYLGPVSDIDKVHISYINFKTALNEAVDLTSSGNIVKAAESLQTGGAVATSREKVLAAIQVIDEFVTQKAEGLYTVSIELSNVLGRQLVILLISVLLLMLIISYLLLQNIRKPLKEMNSTILRFHRGEMDARSNYKFNNEFGVLSSSINLLAELVQKNVLLDRKNASISLAMLSDEDDRKFFQTTLGALAEHTGANMAAVYLLSDDKKNFDYFESIGATESIKQSFAADEFEGVFGTALHTRKTQYIQDIPDDTRFVFQTVNGKFIPKEIITIPIITNNHVIAVISLACITGFSKNTMELLDGINVAMSTRIEGILAIRTIKEFKDILEKQNMELDAQKNELVAQTTELTRQNVELEMQKKQLNEASRLKTIFLSNMSHELRTPLNSVIALTGVLSRRLADKIPEEEYSYLEIIERNGKNLLSLINDVLDISRIEAGHEKIEATKFNANNLIMEVVTTIQPLAKRKDIELLHVSKDEDVTIISDADKFRHILQNLIDNAVKFTQQGNVLISMRHDNEKIEIIVADTGIGISEEHLPYIFDEFRQADDSTSRRFGGTGLGLAISKKYANLLGGNISVKSTPDRGSEFILSLPLSYNPDNQIVEVEITLDSKYAIKESMTKSGKESMTQSKKVSLTRSKNNSSTKNILLVEDNESAIIQIRDLVQEMGLSIEVASDGGKALEIIEHLIPDAMILDLMMPGIDGFQVLEILRNAEATAHIPVLILTAKHITKEELKFLKRNNIHQLIQKGDVDRARLQDVISSLLFPVEVVEVEAAEAAEMPQRKLQLIEGKPVVLVVEDNPDNMITVKALLSDHHTVLEAVDAHEGIEMTIKHLPALVLMDIALSGMDGIQAFREIRNNPQLQHIPIIALTASAMLHDRETILAHGFDAFIAKPIIAKDFFRVIDEVLYGK
ncbi:MAG: response regulator [Saccharofermentanales bacterium]